MQWEDVSDESWALVLIARLHFKRPKSDHCSKVFSSPLSVEFFSSTHHRLLRFSEACQIFYCLWAEGNFVFWVRVVHAPNSPHKNSCNNTLQSWWSHPPKPQPITMLHHHPQPTQHINRLLSPSRFFGELRLIFDRVIWIIYGNYLHWPPS
jgi:hypothetical protein